MIINNIFSNKFNKIFAVAEIGINHNGKLQNAIRLINHAKKAGFSAVKFQFYKPDLLLKKNTPLAIYQKKTNFSNMYEMLKKFSLSNQQLFKLKNHCDNIKIEFMATPFDNESANYLNKLGVKIFKVSSGDLNNYILLRHLKKFNKPIIISTGMSSIRDLKETINNIRFKKNKLGILHCISEYPAKVKNYQLGNIIELKKLKYQVGLSDHTLGGTASLIAVSLGAKIIEKHITLDKRMKGPDHKASLDIFEMEEFILNINDLNASLNNKARFITKIEKKNKLLVTRSLFFSKDLKKNHKLQLEDILPLRPFIGGVLMKDYKTIIGKRLKMDVKKHHLIKRYNF